MSVDSLFDREYAGETQPTRALPGTEKTEQINATATQASTHPVEVDTDRYGTGRPKRVVIRGKISK